MRYEYILKDQSVTYLNKSSISFSLRANVNLIVTQISLYNIKSAYVVDDKIQDIVIQCNIGGASITVGKDVTDITFPCGQSYSANDVIRVTISVLTEDGTFDIPNGVDRPNVTPTDGAAGISNISTSNIPHFAVTYNVTDEIFKHDGAVNDGYFYFDGLATDYGDYSKADWYIDPTKRINEGYMFFDGLLTDYGDYVEDVGGLLMFRNGIRLKAYKDGIEIIPQKQEV